MPWAMQHPARKSLGLLVLLTTAATAELQRDLPSAGLCLEAH